MTQDRFYESFAFKVPPATLRDDWLTFGNGFGLFQDRLTSKVKRVIDMLAVSLIGLLTLPLMILVAVAIKLDSPPGSIFYTQTRTGLKVKPFKVYKYRSMKSDSERTGAQWAQKKDSRITRVGHIMRLLRIDELPQIWNVVKNDMSLIGPRPERPEFDTELD